jgi:hypothetical protein
LGKGQRKALQTDRVRVRPGSNEDIAIVRLIFEKFVLSRLTDPEIARDLNKARIRNHHGRPWTARMVNAILRNEN